MAPLDPTPPRSWPHTPAPPTLAPPTGRGFPVSMQGGPGAPMRSFEEMNGARNRAMDASGLAAMQGAVPGQQMPGQAMQAMPQAPMNQAQLVQALAAQLRQEQQRRVLAEQQLVATRRAQPQSYAAGVAQNIQAMLDEIPKPPGMPHYNGAAPGGMPQQTVPAGAVMGQPDPRALVPQLAPPTRAGGIAGLASELGQYGRHGDTMVAHISPEEAAFLRARGGSGSINPATGLPEFFAQGGDDPGGAVGHGPGPGHAEPGSGARGGGGDGGGRGSRSRSRSRSRGMQAISNAVDQLGGATAETAKSVGAFGAYDDIGRWTARHGLEALANQANVHPVQMAQMMGLGRASRPSQVGIGASAGQNLEGIGVTPMAAGTAVGISGPGFGSEAERVQAMGSAPQTVERLGMTDPTGIATLGRNFATFRDQMAPQLAPPTVQAVNREIQQLQAPQGGPPAQAVLSAADLAARPGTPIAQIIGQTEPSLAQPAPPGVNPLAPAPSAAFDLSSPAVSPRTSQDEIAELQSPMAGDLAAFSNAPVGQALEQIGNMQSPMRGALAGQSVMTGLRDQIQALQGALPETGTPLEMQDLSQPAPDIVQSQRAAGLVSMMPRLGDAPMTAPPFGGPPAPPSRTIQVPGFGVAFNEGDRGEAPFRRTIPAPAASAVAPQPTPAVVAARPEPERRPWPVKQGVFGPYDPALQRLLGLSGPYARAYGSRAFG